MTTRRNFHKACRNNASLASAGFAETQKPFSREQLTSEGKDMPDGSMTACASSVATKSVQSHGTCPSLPLWREYKAAEKALDESSGDDDSNAHQEAVAAYHEAHARFLYAQDATALGVLLKLEMIEEIENLAGHLDEMPNLLWPRVIMTLLRDLRAAVNKSGVGEALVKSVNCTEDYNDKGIRRMRTAHSNRSQHVAMAPSAIAFSLNAYHSPSEKWSSDSSDKKLKHRMPALPLKGPLVVTSINLKLPACSIGSSMGIALSGIAQTASNALAFRPQLIEPTLPGSSR